jgi:hypothetical protein
MSRKNAKDTHSILRLLECAVDVIIGLPNTRYTLLVIPKPLLKMTPKLAQEDSVGGLLINLRSENLPGSLAQSSE